MSVLIKNMEMPEHCGYCRFRYDGICHALQKTQYSAEECPLVSINDINASPTIEPQQWIPVTERLPEEECKHYWICTDTGYQCECRWTNVNPFWTHLTTDWHWNIFDLPQYTKVVAWMPLPMPFREGGAEDA